MEISENRLDRFVVLAPYGRLDSINTPKLQQALQQSLDQGDAHLIINFDQVEYISSMGLSVLLSAAKKIKKLNGSVALVQMNDRIRSIMDVSGFTGIFQIYPSIQDAMQVSVSAS